MRRAYYLGIVAPLFLTIGTAHWLGRRSFILSLLGAAAATGFILYLFPYAVRYRHSGGRFHFTFADPIYAELFAEMNAPSASHASKAVVRTRIQ